MTSDNGIAILFAALGIISAIIGVRQIRQIMFRRRHWKRYSGEVVDYVWESNSSIQIWIMRWTDEHGVTRTAKNPTGSSGGTLRSFPFPAQIMVDPEDPTRAHLARGANSGVGAGIAALVAGLVFLGLGALLGLLA